jgi:hypothetical protein
VYCGVQGQPTHCILYTLRRVRWGRGIIRGRQQRASLLQFRGCMMVVVLLCLVLVAAERGCCFSSSHSV